MSAVLTRSRRTSRTRDRETYRQPSLFGQVAAPPRPEPAEPPVDEQETQAVPVAPRTLDEAISGLWAAVLSADTAECPVCGDELVPQRSGEGAVMGGRCRGCATTLA
jgi:hypothetical protein